MARQRKRADTLTTVVRNLDCNPVTPGDHERLFQELLVKPERALQECKNQGTKLTELPVFQRILDQHPEAAFEIALRAAELGVEFGLSPKTTRPSTPR